MPVLSYAVRHLHTQAGVAITASHNAKEYNGYKVYWEDGAQAVDEIADEIVDAVNAIVDYTDIETMDEAQAKKAGLLVYIDQEVDDPYMADTKSLSSSQDLPKDFRIIYTPIHGTGNVPVRRILDELGYKDVCVVKAQVEPDGNFPTVKAPNPEDPRVFDLAKAYAEQKQADIIFGTDPDCDRLGMLVPDENGEYVRLNGNEIGALFFDYYIKANKNRLPEKGVLIKSIVTGDVTKKIADAHGIKTVEVLTGFKYIGECIKNMEKTDEAFIFGFEESYGYLAGTFVRDKDAVVASMLAADMCAYYRQQGRSILESLNDIYETYGYFSETQASIVLEGKAGVEKIARIMQNFRKNGFPAIDGLSVSKRYDYLDQTKTDVLTGQVSGTGLRKSNVLKYVYDGCSWMTLRPSGTEPKIKIYVSACEATKQESLDKMDRMLNEMKKAIDKID